ncbi:MAG: hypothetical protein LBB43_01490, partial [Spirochaetaceae bacterium]|nr:hypothetical protein [Spirochaetaceae bacterium]
MDITAQYNQNDFLAFLSDHFLPDDFEQSRNAVSIDKPHAVIKSALKLGSCPSLDLSVYEFKHSGIHDPRVSLSRESFKIIETNDVSSRALAVFYNENSAQWRLSLITSDYYIGKTTKQVKRTFSNPRRFSWLLGEGCKRHTPEAMLFGKAKDKDKGKIQSFDDLAKRFAIDAVTKEFYRELFKWYDESAVPAVKYPQGVGAKVQLTTKDNRLHLIRLITRLIFVWFIKQKGLIPEWIFDKKEIESIVPSFDPHSDRQGNYYNAILQNLFFATLNNAVTERAFAEEGKTHYGIKTYYRDHKDGPLIKIPRNEFIKKFESVPFLNGGLFECLDNFDTKEYNDGFSQESGRAAFIPNCLFWGDGEREGIIDLFNRYNFTIEENTPQDIDIALDPELLGKVFENLLGTFNEETSATARKESGSFYTPREIVEYMVDSSLKAYFKGALNDQTSEISNIDERLDRLFSQSEENAFTDEQVPLLIEAIYHCKILDPACGSGAFPMGILNKLVFILEKLDPENCEWKEIQIRMAMKDTEEAYRTGDEGERKERLQKIREVFEQSTGQYGNYGRKLYLIENCIYGVDIQPIAIQISKLRFFISLIVDQKTGGTIDNNYNVLPLPNLETKFV